MSEQFTQDRPLVESELPKHICGGTYRSRTRRRARSSGVKPNYAEQKKRRIERKFGIAGEGKRIGTGDEENEGKPKPRVAQSKRGRELRAKAALERFEKKEEKEEIGIENKDDETVSDSDDEEAINVGGGKFMVAVSGDQDVDGQDIKQELQELLSGACGTVESDIRPDLHPTPVSQPSSLKVPKFDKPSKMHLAALADAETNSAEPCVRTLAPKAKEPFQDQNPAAPDQPRHPISASKQRGTFTTPPPLLVKPGTPPESSSTCPVCSCTNAAYAPTCSACMNVLINPPAADAWKCANESCHSEYRNSQDVVYCGICGAKRLI